MIALVCPDCGAVESAKFDGYKFGDRLLEGIEFSISIRSGQLVASVDSRAQSYLKGNIKRWLEEALVHAKQDDNMLCCVCGEAGTYLEKS